ncbi:anthranilate synthase component 1 [Sphingomonas sp.]|uniref:anthranilate synthase component 1 n=1 Tax=Sphingomonas sp. TaxID=28214 RepID=UPI0025D9520A|nr:anthranilate synthase component 1 [Sphingomonas sp.]MBV9526802.1 anthranilate synthase component 1 [Sphingomonas sp.]
MNAPADVTVGSARSISRRLPTPVDLLALYAELSDGGRRADTLMIETTAGRNLIVDRAAIRIECRGGEVVLTALSVDGEPVLDIVERKLAVHVAERASDRLILRYERSAAVDAEVRLRAPSPFDVLRTITALAIDTPEEPMTICLAGVVGFDHVDFFEDLPANAEDLTGFPDFIFWLAQSAVIAEPRMTPRLLCTSFNSGDPEQDRRSRNSAIDRLSDLAFRASDVRQVSAAPGAAATVSVDQSDEDFAAAVLKLKEHVLAGDVYQIVASRTFSAHCPDPLSAFARVRALDRSPYMFFVSMADSVLFGASPETSVRVTRERGKAVLEVKPIAGTRPRGQDGDQDNRMEADLRLDEKEAAEHMMLVDLARNDVARVSEPGTRHVDRLMTLEKYARVMHLVSSVKGVLAPRFDALHALQACLNVGTLSGAPKLKATELLRRYERTRRGAYGGAIGWLNGEGLMDTGVVIRSALVRNGTAHVRAGAGIVHDSDPVAEADETRRKASAVLTAIAGEQVR